MSLKEQFEAVATAKGWTFVYGRRDFQNLFDATGFVADTLEGVGNDETVLFLDPIKEATTDIGENGNGTFMLLTRANHDKPYAERYTLFIEPLRAELKAMRQGFKCLNDVTRWEKTEVINIFDLNADGYLVNYAMVGYD